MAKSGKLKFVTITSNWYGNDLKGTKIYYEGKKPDGFKKDGSIAFGKNILEHLRKQLKKFHWILTPETDSITKKNGIFRVRTSLKTLSTLNKPLRERTRDIKNDIVEHSFSKIYPDHFKSVTAAVYVSGTISKIITKGIHTKLSADDRDALNSFLPEFIASESISAVNTLKAEAQIKTLKELSLGLRRDLDVDRGEAWWQTYIQKNILIIQQGYIHAIPKMNITIGDLKFPDFSLITHDGFLDILEIKRPGLKLMKLDKDRNNYHWDTEMSKATIQIENYLENVVNQADAVRSYILDKHGINLKVVRPRGIILAGDARKFSLQKEKDDFRRLTQGHRNIQFLTYDELLTRLENYIEVLEKYAPKVKKVKK